MYFRTHQTQHVNTLVQKEIKTGPPEIEYGSLSQVAFNNVNSIKEEVPDELEAKLAVITSQPERSYSKKGETHELTEKDTINNESDTQTIRTDPALNWTLGTEEIFLIDKVNNKSTIDNIKHKQENKNGIIIEQPPSSHETRKNTLELVAGATSVSSLNISEVDKTQILECTYNLKEKNNLKNVDLAEPKQISKLSVSDLVQSTIILTNVNDIEPQSVINAKEISEDSPKVKIQIDSNLLNSRSRSRTEPEGSLGTDNINHLNKKNHRETVNNKSIVSLKTQNICNVITTTEPDKAVTNVKNQEKISVNMQITPNSYTSKLNVYEQSYLQIQTPQHSQKFNIDGSGNQELYTDLQFTVASEMSRKINEMPTNEEGNKMNRSDDTKSTGPIKPPQLATVNEAESATKKALEEIINKPTDAVKKDVEDKPITVKSQTEEHNNRNGGDQSEFCKPHFYSPIKSKSNANNTKEDSSPKTEVNGTLQGVDEVRGRKLEQEMSAYLRKEYNVLSVINKGRYSIIYKCKDSLGRAYAAKVIK